MKNLLIIWMLFTEVLGLVIDYHTTTNSIVTIAILVVLLSLSQLED